MGVLVRRGENHKLDHVGADVYLGPNKNQLLASKFYLIICIPPNSPKTGRESTSRPTNVPRAQAHSTA